MKTNSKDSEFDNGEKFELQIQAFLVLPITTSPRCLRKYLDDEAEFWDETTFYDFSRVLVCEDTKLSYKSLKDKYRSAFMALGMQVPSILNEPIDESSYKRYKELFNKERDPDEALMRTNLAGEVILQPEKSPLELRIITRVTLSLEEFMGDVNEALYAEQLRWTEVPQGACPCCFNLSLPENADTERDRQYFRSIGRAGV